MNGNASSAAFVCQVKRQLEILNDPEYGYEVLNVYVAGVREAWEIYPSDEVELESESGLLIYRRDPTDEDNYGNEDVPENVIRLEAIVGTELA
jgi:hypothetical protein